ncbi:MAG TPA: histidine kinase dimerization/phosphoacceptor domain -containing protein, partial [Acetobacteraceae bacterium]
MPSPEAALLSPRLRQQELVASFGLFAMQAENLQVILSEASAAAARGMDVRFGKVLEHLPSENSFLVRAGIGWRPGVVGQARLRGDLESPAGYAFRTAQPVVCNALNAEERFRTPQLLAEHGVMSAINVIISAGNAPPFGVLEADSTHRGDFGGHDVAFLQSLANTLAVAIEMQKRQDARMELLRDKEALLREKDLLMQEIHHRVKNSLQLVRTLLSLQARGLSNPEAREKLTDAAGRILTISAVHQRLYGGGSLGRIDAVQYLRGLLDDMQAMRAGTAPIALSAEPFELAADDMTSLGLIVTELV